MNTFIGRLKISRESRAGSASLPFLVEVWDEDANERDEGLEKKFATVPQAELYARSLTDDAVPSIPLVYEGEPDNRWSAPVRIKAGQ